MITYKYFVFDTLLETQAALDKCNAALSTNISRDSATGWDEIRQRSDGKYYFKKPEDHDFSCTGCTEAVKCTLTEEDFNHSLVDDPETEVESIQSK